MQIRLTLNALALGLALAVMAALVEALYVQTVATPELQALSTLALGALGFALGALLTMWYGLMRLAMRVEKEIAQIQAGRRPDCDTNGRRM